MINLKVTINEGVILTEYTKTFKNKNAIKLFIEKNLPIWGKYKYFKFEIYTKKLRQVYFEKKIKN